MGETPKTALAPLKKGDFKKIRTYAKLPKILIYPTALRVMPPARLRRTPVPHFGNQKDRTGSPSRQERQEYVACA
jgi:hypothetical protein